MNRWILRIAAVLAAAAGIEYLCIQPLRGNLILDDVEQRTIVAQSAIGERAASAAWTNLHDLQRIARACRLDPAWYLVDGANWELLQRWPEAVDAYTRALRVDERPEIYFNRGRVKLYLGQTDAAAADMATAARFDPGVLEQIDGELRARVAAAAGVQ